ncbi:MAG: electron transport complex subunit RsxC [Buchnera aphidicola (Nurudea yanoniella)]
MFLLNKINDFYGGIDFISMKTNKSSSQLNHLIIPKKFCVLVDGQILLQKKIIVSPGEMVLRGQMLAVGSNDIAPIHSPTSGIIASISKKKFNFISNKYFGIINIKSDGSDKWIHRVSTCNYKELSYNTLIQLIYDSGIVGLGGSGFLSSKKLKYALKCKMVHTLVVNAAESEPYITSDDCLIKNFSDDIIKGCQIIKWILKIKNVLIAIESDKIISYEKMKNIIEYFSDFEIRKITTRYPSGSSKQLIKILFDKEVPLGKHAIDLGIIIFNVATIFAIKRAVLNGEPLTERIVTISDVNLSFQKNILTRIGTPIDHILKQFNIDAKKNKFILGGPITGIIINDLNFSIIKTSNSILYSEFSFNNNLERPCIRCTACSSACPMFLFPEQLYFYSKSFDHLKSQEYNINECIECGICEQVCPSNIPLLTYFRKEKLKLKERTFKKNISKKFKNLFISRQSRLYSSGAINENIICSSNILSKSVKKKFTQNKNIDKIFVKNVEHTRQKTLEESIRRAKFKRNIK